MNERSIDPITLVLKNGEERKFLLSMGDVRRLKTKFGVKLLSEILEQDACDCGIAVLYAALLDKGAMTEDEFAELLPAHVEVVIKAVARLLGASFPDPKPDDRPTLPSPTVP